MRGHLDAHPELYFEQVELGNWPVLAKFAKLAFAAGYTLKTLKEMISQPGIDIYCLPPAPPKDSSDMPQKQPLGAELPEFSHERLHEYIVQFLVAEDLVRSTEFWCLWLIVSMLQAINKVESSYFRELLLFASSCTDKLKDSNLPHRMKT